MIELSESVAIAFADQLRTARLAALSNAEGYDAVVYVIERLGAYLSKDRLGDQGERGSLGSYEAELLKLASHSPLAQAVPDQNRGLLTPFGALID